MPKIDSSQPRAWWQFGHVWLVIAGPAVVVVASLVTLYLAASSKNELVYDEAKQPVTRIDSSGLTGDASTLPAMQVRNHLQAGVVVGAEPSVKQP